MKKRSFSQTIGGNLALESKINFYRQKFNQSSQKFKTKYSWVNTDKTNQDKNYMSNTTKVNSIKRNNSAKLRVKQGQNRSQIYQSKSQINPQNSTRSNVNQLTSKLVRTLNNQTKQITQYAEINTHLLENKRNLQKHIEYLKQAIAKQNRLTNRSKVNCDSLKNQIDKTNKRFSQANQKSKNLQYNIMKTNQQIQILENVNKQRKQHSKADQNYIKSVEQHNYMLSEVKITNLKAAIFKQENQRVKYKAKLTHQLKVMENNAILYQQNLNQRANIKSNIQNYVNENKMVQTPLNKSRKFN